MPKGEQILKKVKKNRTCRVSHSRLQVSRFVADEVDVVHEVIADPLGKFDPILL